MVIPIIISKFITAKIQRNFVNQRLFQILTLFNTNIQSLIIQ
nr:MAG TPA: hypothetical protein [Caudoviricetes sp.]